MQSTWQAGSRPWSSLFFKVCMGDGNGLCVYTDVLYRDTEFTYILHHINISGHPPAHPVEAQVPERRGAVVEAGEGVLCVNSYMCIYM